MGNSRSLQIFSPASLSLVFSTFLEDFKKVVTLPLVAKGMHCGQSH